MGKYCTQRVYLLQHSSCVIYTELELQIIYIEDMIVFYIAQKEFFLGNERPMGYIAHLNNERVTLTIDFYALTKVTDNMQLCYLYIKNMKQCCLCSNKLRYSILIYQLTTQIISHNYIPMFYRQIYFFNHEYRISGIAF